MLTYNLPCRLTLRVKTRRVDWLRRIFAEIWCIGKSDTLSIFGRVAKIFLYVKKPGIAEGIAKLEVDTTRDRRNKSPTKIEFNLVVMAFEFVESLLKDFQLFGELDEVNDVQVEILR